jgi:hypothetical protein
LEICDAFGGFWLILAKSKIGNLKSKIAVSRTDGATFSTKANLSGFGQRQMGMLLQYPFFVFQCSVIP